jgi:coenzyme Q-binding protein COQ10
MPKHAERRHLAYRPDQVYDLVADVGRYPEFLPWVIGARVASRNDREMVADLVIGFKMFRERFTSRVALDRPHHIHVDYVSGPLKFLHNDWKFLSNPDGTTTVEFRVDFQFKSRMFEAVVGALFTEAVHRMVSAFEKRAAAIYGSADTGGALPTVG